MRLFNGKTVLITGTSRGIGKGLVKYFSDRKATVCSVTRVSCINLPTNVIEIISDIKNVDYIMEQLEHRNYHIDILINNAGINCYADLLEVSKEQIDHVFATNVIDTFLLSQAIAEQMIREGRSGNIINTISFAAKIPSIGSGIYAASKAALASLTKTMAAEWACYGIRVNGYSPGVVETDMTKPIIEKNRMALIEAIAMHRIATVEQIMDVVGFLASDESSYMTGVNLDVSGGKLIVQNPAAGWKGDI